MSQRTKRRTHQHIHEESERDSERVLSHKIIIHVPEESLHFSIKLTARMIFTGPFSVTPILRTAQLQRSPYAINYGA